MAAPTGFIWDSTTWGYAPIYWLTIAGIPGVFTQRVIGKALPTGFQSFEDAGLSLEGTAAVGIEQIDRDTGMGCGMSLSFTLLDSATLAGQMQRWTLNCALTATANAGDPSMTVNDNSAWPASGAFYIGMERVKYGHKNVGNTKFEDLDRGDAGTLDDTWRVGTTGQIITDRPRSFRGREVRLYAAFADPSGYVKGATLADASVEVWRGRIQMGPSRRSHGFAFEASSLDRVLTVGLPGAVTGDVLGADEYVSVSPLWQLECLIYGTLDDITNVVWGPYTIKIAPFDAAAIITASEARAAITAAWAAEVAAQGIGTDVGGLTWTPYYYPSLGKTVLSAGIWIPYQATVRNVVHKTRLGILGTGKEYQIITNDYYPWDKAAASTSNINHNDTNPQLAYFKWWNADPTIWTAGGKAEEVPTTLRIELTEGDPANVATSGRVRVKGSRTVVYSYTGVTVDQARLHLSSCTPANPGDKALTVNELGDSATAEILFEDTGAWKTLMLNCIESSGTGARGTYDVLDRAQGYNLPEEAVDLDSFDLLDEVGPSAFQGAVCASGASFVEMFGGVLALFRLALVCQPMQTLAGTPVKLQIVSLRTPVGTHSVTDTRLLAHAGDPITTVEAAPGPTTIKIESEPAGSEKNRPLIYNDNVGGTDRGRVEVTYRIDTPNRAALDAAAFAAVTAIFSVEGTLQAAEVLVDPSQPINVGETVTFSTVHPALWTFGTSPGCKGFTGEAAVTGRTIDPNTNRLKLKLLLDGGTAAPPTGYLCPSMLVLSWTGDPDEPTTITVSDKYAEVLAKQAAVQLPFYLNYYEPGDEGTVNFLFEVTGVNGAVLSTSSSLDAPLTTTMRLTFPPTADADVFQIGYAHVDDGGYWGP
jgi:hypothetical protein